MTAPVFSLRSKMACAAVALLSEEPGDDILDFRPRFSTVVLSGLEYGLLSSVSAARKSCLNALLVKRVKRQFSAIAAEGGDQDPPAAERHLGDVLAQCRPARAVESDVNGISLQDSAKVFGLAVDDDVSADGLDKGGLFRRPDSGDDLAAGLLAS